MDVDADVEPYHLGDHDLLAAQDDPASSSLRMHWRMAASEISIYADYFRKDNDVSGLLTPM